MSNKVKATLYYSGIQISPKESNQALTFMAELLEEYGVDAFELHLVDIDYAMEVAIERKLSVVPTLETFDGERFRHSPLVGDLQSQKRTILAALGVESFN